MCYPFHWTTRGQARRDEEERCRTGHHDRSVILALFHPVALLQYPPIPFTSIARDREIWQMIERGRERRAKELFLLSETPVPLAESLSKSRALPKEASEASFIWLQACSSKDSSSSIMIEHRNCSWLLQLASSENETPWRASPEAHVGHSLPRLPGPATRAPMG